MRWIKNGLIYVSEGKYGFDFSHCHKPTPFLVDQETVRLYFGTRDDKNRTRTTFIDLDANNLSRVKYIHSYPVIDLGRIGTFDDSGAQVCSVVQKDNLVYLYYIGWNTSTTVPSRNALGLAISKDNGLSFYRLYEGPILERYKEEAFHIGASDVLIENNKWKIWYNAGMGFKTVNGRPEYTLNIKFATSDDGINWIRENITCIKPNDENEVIGRPSVISDNGIYKMWYSRRSLRGFRENSEFSYKAGYAESLDGITWIRKDNKVGIDISNNLNDWDSDMIAYPYVIKLKGKMVMFYNGNNFGKTGVGYATIEK